MELQKNQNSTTSDLIGGELFKLNLLVVYPYSDETIDYMAKTLLRIMPDVSLQSLTFLMDKYLTGLRSFKKENGFAQIVKDLNAISSSYVPTERDKW